MYAKRALARLETTLEAIQNLLKEYPYLETEPTKKTFQQLSKVVDALKKIPGPNADDDYTGGFFIPNRNRLLPKLLRKE